LAAGKPNIFNYQQSILTGGVMADDAGVPVASAIRSSRSESSSHGSLFLASFIALYFELLIIRYVSSELRAFVTLKNLPLIASFFGIGLGILCWKGMRGPKSAFLLVSLALFTIIRFGAHLPLPAVGWEYELLLAGNHSLWFSLAAYLAEVLAVLWLIVLFFVVLGTLVGKHFQQESALAAYGVNLLGSLAGMLAFTLLSFLSTGPVVWLALGFALVSVFFWRKWLHLTAFALLLVIVGIPQPNTYWSPYNRIDIIPVRTPGSSVTSEYHLRYNHMLYQTMVDLSSSAAQNQSDVYRSIADYFELPYRFVPAPHNVLVVGAGTGNDVAAALRHGAEHVDAVEIDPGIMRLGRKLHPEQPYASRKVTAYVDDARAYFQKCHRKYDLIVFGFLDSSALLSSFSSLRLDNYVFTRESFEAARNLLTPDGTMILAFAVTRGYAADRLFATLTSAFGTEPQAVLTQTNVLGIVYIEGEGKFNLAAKNTRDVSSELHASSRGAILATDDWPFLYLEAKRIPPALYLAMMIFVASLWFWQSNTLQQQSPPGATQFFMLGVGFLLLETRAVTQLSLLFGTTWLVVTVVVTAFLFMALLANAVAAKFAVNTHICYGLVLTFILLGMALPYSRIAGFSIPAKLAIAGLGAALPVFFSGMIFSSALKHCSIPSAALGVNLLGAVIGGVLENSVIIGGIALVGGLAVLAYAVAWLSSMRKSTQPPLVPDAG
jgi:hypothetical protein